MYSLVKHSFTNQELLSPLMNYMHPMTGQDWDDHSDEWAESLIISPVAGTVIKSVVIIITLLSVIHLLIMGRYFPEPAILFSLLIRFVMVFVSSASHYLGIFCGTDRERNTTSEQDQKSQSINPILRFHDFFILKFIVWFLLKNIPMFTGSFIL